MVRKDADGASALMLYRKKPEEALQAAEPMFIAAPPAEATTEVRPNDLEALDCPHSRV